MGKKSKQSWFSVEIDLDEQLFAEVRVVRAARAGWGMACYEKIINKDGNTEGVYQIIYNEDGVPILEHRKFPRNRERSLI